MLTVAMISLLLEVRDRKVSNDNAGAWSAVSLYFVAHLAHQRRIKIAINDRCSLPRMIKKIISQKQIAVAQKLIFYACKQMCPMRLLKTYSARARSSSQREYHFPIAAPEIVHGIVLIDIPQSDNALDVSTRRTDKRHACHDKTKQRAGDNQ